MTFRRLLALRLRSAVICAALICFALSALSQATTWKSYDYPADGFQASFPAAPMLQRKDVNTQAGIVGLHSYAVQQGDFVLFVAVCDYGQKAASVTTEKELEGAKNGALINSGSHLMSEKKISLDGHPGIEFEAASGTANFKARIYAVGPLLYQSLVISSQGKSYEDTQKFLDSFRLIARTPVEPASK
jgi:hypothetical protein